MEQGGVERVPQTETPQTEGGRQEGNGQEYQTERDRGGQR